MIHSINITVHLKWWLKPALRVIFWAAMLRFITVQVAYHMGGRLAIRGYRLVVS